MENEEIVFKLNMYRGHFYETYPNTALFFFGWNPRNFPRNISPSIEWSPKTPSHRKPEAKAIPSHLVARPFGCQKFQPRFWVGFFGRLSFQTQFGGFLGAQKICIFFLKRKFYLYEMFSRSTIVQMKCHLFSSLLPISFLGKPFWGNLFLLEMYISNTQIFTKEDFRCCLEDAHHRGLSFFQGLLRSLGIPCHKSLALWGALVLN